VAEQQQWLDQVITYIEEQAVNDDEPPADWMVCRVVAYDDHDGSMTHAWLPDG